MKIGLVAAETLPLSKSGGLADYVYSLANAFAAAGHHVDVMVPDYAPGGTSNSATGTNAAAPISVNGRQFTVSEESIGEWRALKIGNSELFSRERMYGYDDDPVRFGHFSAAVSALASAGDYDVLHCNDWQTGFVPLLLKQRKSDLPTVFAIHNLEFQGNYSPSLMDEIGIDHSYFFIEGIEFYGNVSAMKAGIVYCDRLVTVSPTYSQEIQTPEYGFRMDGVIRKYAGKLRGILNGIDYRMWNPETDRSIPANYSRDNRSGKAVCKSHTQREFSLPQVRRPLIVSIGRLWRQKGIDLLLDALQDIEEGFQFIILGTGDPDLMRKVQDMASSTPGFRAVLRYDEQLAHRLYAAADVFVMPSRFEPCGLSQMISMRYGTVPVVRRTGGLADTVTQFDPDTATGEGFLFEDENHEQLADAIGEALSIYSSPEIWRSAVINCMTKNFSWDASASKYAELYGEIVRTPKVS
ncbi:MAG: glycogen synthase [Thermoplasmata archaeon]|uniref:Probable glycogen synthase n=1 Tax=Candidatus Sysuiplasma superficiale TaxID=2823368 RepID=A0A8J7YN36_9ARCH|nr:glycogen synthase [Candidatus Sysuiplasma superficiale]MBX8643425.1 glycogen synthase [Candidatus Sysuiplasma superficiale]